jgi:Flp pilus assembly protein TadG
MRLFHRKRNGQGLVEFAFVFPIFIMLLLGVFDIGRAVFAYNEITNAAREGVRIGIVNQDPTSIQDRIMSQTSGTPVDQCVFFIESTSSFPTCDKGTTTPADECSTLKVGCIVHVEVWTNYTAITPIIGNFLGPMTLTANSEGGLEFVCPNPEITAWASSASCPKQP